MWNFCTSFHFTIFLLNVVFKLNKDRNIWDMTFYIKKTYPLTEYIYHLSLCLSLFYGQLVLVWPLNLYPDTHSNTDPDAVQGLIRKISSSSFGIDLFSVKKIWDSKHVYTDAKVIWKLNLRIIFALCDRVPGHWLWCWHHVPLWRGGPRCWGGCRLSSRAILPWLASSF